MKTFTALLFSLFAAVAIASPNVESVKIRQLWPWSSDIRVEYTLSGYENGVNLKFEAYDGENKIADFDKLQGAAKGKFRAINTESGSFDIDMKAIGLSAKAVSNFNIKLQAVEDDELYRIYDLTTGEYDKVTRGELLNGDYGTVETDFGKVGRAFGVDGFNTTLTDVIIWTGVTNDVVYKTTKLVMRKILAKDKSFMMGVHEGDAYANYNAANSPLHEVSFTNDYYIAVFELTDGQFQTIITNSICNSTLTIAGSDKMQFKNETYRYVRPVNVPDYIARRDVAKWPGGPKKGAFASNRDSLIGNLRALTGEIGFDLPTESFWEYSCRAGTTASFNSGLNDTSTSHLNAISRTRWNSNMDYSGSATGTKFNNATALETWTPMDGGSAIVGTYAPNAWGLYDMHGNMYEWCLDHCSDNPTAYEGYTSNDPWGIAYTSVGVFFGDVEKINNTYERDDPKGDRLNHVMRGGTYYYTGDASASAARGNASANSGSNPALGIRLCITIFD
jgi:formylglycine-generating enzyme required for sulfatase activity